MAEQGVISSGLGAITGLITSVIGGVGEYITGLTFFEVVLLILMAILGLIVFIMKVYYEKYRDQAMRRPVKRKRW